MKKLIFFLSLIPLLALASPQVKRIRSSVPPSYTGMLFYSQAGDFIGAGKYHMFSSLPNDFTASSSVNHLSLYYSHGSWGGSSWFSADFAAPDGAALKSGFYAQSERYPFQDPGYAGLDVSGDGRGCNISSGQFDVLEAQYDGNGDVQHFAANFVQHCEDGSAALIGAVRYHSSLPLITPAKATFGSSSAGITVPFVAFDNVDNLQQFKQIKLVPAVDSQHYKVASVESSELRPNSIPVPASYRSKSETLVLPVVTFTDYMGSSNYRMILQNQEENLKVGDILSVTYKEPV